jgi:ribonuclease T1
MSNEPPAGRPKSSSSAIALLVAIVVGVIYFLNTGGLARLLPEEYNVTLTPTPAAASEAAFAQGEAGGAEAEAVAAIGASPTEVVAEEAPTETPTAAPAAVPATINGLPTILWDELPPQAWETIELIDQGGPFPYDRDGITFQNRERLLPQERDGFYREYTVVTPGSSTRGARRIIEGDDGVLYYTDDHYDSFSVVVR